jgi:hypothetical protein
MNIPRIVVLTITLSATGSAANLADGPDNTPLPTDSIHAVRDGISSPAATQK